MDKVKYLPGTKIDLLPQLVSMLIDIKDIIPDSRNPRVTKKLSMLLDGIRRFGVRWPIVVNKQTNVIEAGHQRFAAMQELGATQVPVLWADDDGKTASAFNIADNKLGEVVATWDEDALQGLLRELGNSDALQGLGFEDDELKALLTADAMVITGEDVTATEDQAEALCKKWNVQADQLWQLGVHRLYCGDSTSAANVEALMQEEKASLVHADPPYGMGKEKKGVANDNLYGEKLDAFQMQWWRACRSCVQDNSSVYIWGTAEDLFRLWFKGGLKDSEVFTFRNEIIWDKGNAIGMKSDSHRMYPTATERCLFFILGAQGFNTNQDNYWEGWDSILNYLREQLKIIGWTESDTKKIAGHKDSYNHWFSKSQWAFPTQKVYEAWQDAAVGKAFNRSYNELKQEYDELKQEFYSSRAYFDNTHDIMTDVWSFDRVVGEERYGHATPKPVEMIRRIIKSSLKEMDICYEPFGGTGTTLIACEQIKRQCRMMEIEPNYVAIILQRFADLTGKQPELIHG